MIDETKSEKPTGDIILNSAQGSALDDAAHDELEWNPEREQEQILDNLLAEKHLNRSNLSELNLAELMDRQHKDVPAGRDRRQLQQMNNARHKIFKQVLEQTKDRDLNQLNSHGQTLLHVAAKEGRSRCLEILLRRGADPNITTKESQTLLDIIRMYPRNPTSTYPRNMFLWNVYDLYLLAEANPEDIFFCHSNPSSSKQNGKTVSFRLKELDAAEKYLNGINATLSQSKLHWFHCPSTAGVVILSLARAIGLALSASNASDELDQELFEFVTERFTTSFSVITSNPLLNYLNPSLQTKPGSGGKFRSIVFPCLTMQTVKRHVDRKRQIQKKRAQLPLQHNRPLARWDMTRFKTIHLERTLDEASYPGLSTDLLSKRNDDQVVARESARASGTQEDNTHTETPILLVAQLWLWRLDNIILSAHSLTPESTLNDDPYLPKRHPLSLEDDAQSAWDLIAYAQVPDLQLGLIIAAHIRRFEQSYDRAGVTFLPTLEFFDSAVVSVLSDVDDYLGTESVSKLDIGKEKTFLHHISDIRNELAMIQEILDQQDEILGSLMDDIQHQRTKDGQPLLKHDERSWDVITQAKDLLKKYIKRTAKIDRDAERIERAVLDKLNLKRTHASIQDAHNSVILGAAVIGFTVVTIIFTPLSFLVGLFALPVDQFSGLQYKQEGNAGTLKGKDLAAIFVTIEILTLVVTFGAVAFSMWSLGLWNRLASGKPPNWGEWGLNRKTRWLWNHRKEGAAVDDSDKRPRTKEGLEEQEPRSPRTGELRHREFGPRQRSDKEVV